VVIEAPEVDRDHDRYGREHDISEEPSGVALDAHGVDDRAEERRNDEAAERAEAADEARRAADSFGHIFRNHLEHRGIAVIDIGEDERAGENAHESEDRRALAADALG